MKKLVKHIKFFCLAIALCWVGEAAAQQNEPVKSEFTVRCEKWLGQNELFSAPEYGEWVQQHFGAEGDSPKKAEERMWGRLNGLEDAFLDRFEDPATVSDAEFSTWITPRVKDMMKKTLLDLLVAGGFTMIPLVLCSIVGVTFAILRWFENRPSVYFPDDFLGGIQSHLTGPDGSAAKAIKHCEELIANNRYLAPSARMCKAGLGKISQGAPAVEAALEDAGIQEVDRLKRGLRPLQVVIAVAPLLGLVGTVYGMIGAFQSMQMGGSADKVAVLSKGIYEALVTTATGLTIAIPLMVIYHFINSKVDALAEHFNTLAGELLETCCPSQGSEEEEVSTSSDGGEEGLSPAREDHEADDTSETAETAAEPGDDSDVQSEEEREEKEPVTA